MRLIAAIEPSRRIRWGWLLPSDHQGGSDEVVLWHWTAMEVPMRLMIGVIGPSRRFRWGYCCHQTTKQVQVMLFCDIGLPWRFRRGWFLPHRTTMEVLMRLFGVIVGPSRRFRWGCLVMSDCLGGSDEVDCCHQTTKEAPMSLFGGIGLSRRFWWGCLVPLDHLGTTEEVPVMLFCDIGLP
jgi:hypothetical protein